MLSIIQTPDPKGDGASLFTPCNLLAQRLPLAKRELNLPRLLKRFPKYAVPLVGEIGSLQQSRRMDGSPHCPDGATTQKRQHDDHLKPAFLWMGCNLQSRHDHRPVHHCLILEMNLKKLQTKKRKRDTDIPIRMRIRIVSQNNQIRALQFLRGILIVVEKIVVVVHLLLVVTWHLNPIHWSSL